MEYSYNINVKNSINKKKKTFIEKNTVVFTTIVEPKETNYVGRARREMRKGE